MAKGEGGKSTMLEAAAKKTLPPTVSVLVIASCTCIADFDSSEEGVMTLYIHP
jgi:hypothetical protein